MPIDRSQPPTNKVLLECGPVGTEPVKGCEAFCARIPICNSSILGYAEWSMMGYERGTQGGGMDLWIECTPNARAIPQKTSMHIGHVKTLGEVISIYETLSQKKWPGCD